MQKKFKKDKIIISMNHTLRAGLIFGLASGIITTLGLMVGLHSGTHDKLVIIGAILTIAIADAFSDALGIHITEEAKNHQSQKEIWEVTIATFIFKFLFSLSFIVPVLLFSLGMAVVISIIYGLFLLGLASFYIAKEQKIKPYVVIGEHLGIATVVILITHFTGDWISRIFS